MDTAQSEKQLEQQIESVRARMYRVAKELGFAHPATLQISWQLDQLILQQQQLYKELFHS